MFWRLGRGGERKKGMGWEEMRRAERKCMRGEEDGLCTIEGRYAGL
jgi:hypothetical protein